jgi:hypothetical protein
MVVGLTIVELSVQSTHCEEAVVVGLTDATVVVVIVDHVL